MFMDNTDVGLIRSLKPVYRRGMMVNLRDIGMPIDEIAKCFKVAPGYVERLGKMPRAPHPVRPVVISFRVTKEEAASVRSKAAPGESINQAARRLLVGK